MGNKRRAWVRIVAALVCLAALSLVYVGYSTVAAALEAEHDLHALICTLRLVEEFVNRTERWPANWDELARLSDVHPSSMYNWPEDRDEIERRVSIDFDSQLEDLAALPEPRLLPISVRSKYYDFSDRYKFLFDAVRQTVHDRKGSNNLP